MKVDIVFDDSPMQEGPRFIETETENGHGIGFGEWLTRDDGHRVLRLPVHAAVNPTGFGVWPKADGGINISLDGAMLCLDNDDTNLLLRTLMQNATLRIEPDAE